MKGHQRSFFAPPIGRQATPDDRCTPPEIIGALLELWPQGIGLDPCSNPWSVVPARRRIDEGEDSLVLSPAEWASHGTIYLNPPYSSPAAFIKHAREAAEYGAEAVALVRHDSTTEWSRACEVASALCTVRTRLRFRKGGEDTGPADHATSIYLWLPAFAPDRLVRFYQAFSPIGPVWWRAPGPVWSQASSLGGGQ